MNGQEATIYEANASSLLATMPQTDIVVCNQQSYERAGAMLQQIAKIKKGIQAEFAEPKKKAHEAHKALTALEKRFLDFASQGEAELRNKIEHYWQAEQARIAAEEERKRIESEKQMQIAANAEAAGDTETAEIATALAAMEESTVTAAPKAAGVSMREVWSAEIEDITKVPREYLIPDMNALNALAKAMKKESPIPGVKFVKSISSSVRAK